MSVSASRVLVTGANGFVGSHLAEALVAAGYQVRCMVRRTSNLAFIRDLPVEWSCASLDDRQALREAVRGIDVVYHCAAITRALDEATFLRVNAGGSEALALASLDAGTDLQRFVYVSSQTAAGPAQGPEHWVDESDPPRPITWYGRSKLAAEEALLALSERLPLTIVRPAAVFGPRDRDFYAYFQLVRRGLSLRLGRRERLVSLIYVRDLITLLLLVLQSERTRGQTYFACGTPLSYAQFSDAIAQTLSKRPLSITLPEGVLGPIVFFAAIQAALTRRPPLLNNQRVLDMEQRYWLCSGDKARKELGFEPQTDLETAVRETAVWYRDNGWL